MNRVSLNKRSELDRPLTWAEMDNNWQVIADYLYSIGMSSDNAMEAANKAMMIAGESPLAGIARPSDNPNVQQGVKATFIATEKGTYTNYGNQVVSGNEIAVLYYDGTSWSKSSFVVDLSGYVSDESLEESLQDRWLTVKFAGIVDDVSVQPMSSSSDANERNSYFHTGKQAFVFKGTDGKYYSNARGGDKYNTLSLKARTDVYYIYNGKQYAFNGTTLGILGFVPDAALDEGSVNPVQNKVVTSELLRRYKTIGFAGVVTSQVLPASTPVKGTAETVYFSTVRKCFVVKNGLTYYPNWENANLWNDKTGTDSPVAYSDCYYVNDGKQYLFNGTVLGLVGGGNADDVAMENYTVAPAYSAIVPTDSVSDAVAKLEAATVKSVQLEDEQEEVEQPAEVTVDRAVKDGLGNIIPSTYATKKELESQMPAIEEAANNAIQNINKQRVTPEMLSPETKQLIEAAGGGTINNLPDGEDLTVKEIGDGDTVLKFADREYNPENFSGLGYVYLRKNVQDGKNVLTQDMINKPNVIYEIRYAYDLNGATINIPENCVLKFNGGSLSNGEVILSNGVNIIGGNNSSLRLSGLTCYGKNIISDIIFDGENASKGIICLGNDISIKKVNISNIKYIDSSFITSAVRIGINRDDENLYENISINGCIFEKVEPFNLSEQEEQNQTVARHILAYNVNNLDISNNIFKELNGTKNSDGIQIVQKEIEDLTYPYYTETENPIPEGSYIFRRMRYSDSNSIIRNNMFFSFKDRSFIKLEASGVLVDGNVFNILQASDNLSVVRDFQCRDNVFTNNIFNIAKDASIPYIYSSSNSKNSRFEGNSVNILGLVYAIFYSIYTLELSIKYNEAKGNAKSLLYDEYSKDLRVSQNKFLLTLQSKDTINVNLFYEAENHAVYPSIETDGSIAITQNSIHLEAEDSVKSVKIFPMYSGDILISGNNFIVKDTIQDIYVSPSVFVAKRINININDIDVPLRFAVYSKKGSGTLDCINIKRCKVVFVVFSGSLKGSIKDCTILGGDSATYCIKITSVTEVDVESNFFTESSNNKTKVTVDKGICKLNWISNYIPNSDFNTYFVEGSGISGGIYIPNAQKITNKLDKGTMVDITNLLKLFNLNDGFIFILDRKSVYFDSIERKFLTSDGNPADALTTGTFAQKPAASTGIKVGFQYLATDVRNANAIKGMVIYHKGNDKWIAPDGTPVISVTSLAKDAVLFNGVIAESAQLASASVKGTPENVYYSSADKFFVVKNGEQYYRNWDDDNLWNENSKESPKPYADKYYISAANDRYKWNNTDLVINEE